MPLTLWGFGSISAVLLGIAGLLAFKRLVLISRGKPAVGHIVERTPHRLVPFWIEAWISYEDQTGNVYRLRIRRVARRGQYPVGTPTAMLYDPSAPGTAALANFSELWASSLALATLGLMFAAFAALAVFG